MAKMKFLTQVRIITQDDFEYYLQDFPEEPRNFQGYVNLELGILFDEQYPVLSVYFISGSTVVISFIKRKFNTSNTSIFGVFLYFKF